MTDQPNSNVRQPTGWPRAATPCDLKPRWAGEFRDFNDWVSFASSRLSGCEGSVGQEVPAICVDALGRRCHVGKDFQRARDEGAFPVRYFWECQPAEAGKDGGMNALLPLLQHALGVDASRPSPREARMIIDIECPFCNGAGRVHSRGRNGDPMDGGEDCPRCEGTGCVEHDLNEDADDE